MVTAREDAVKRGQQVLAMPLVPSDMIHLLYICCYTHQRICRLVICSTLLQLPCRVQGSRWTSPDRHALFQEDVLAVHDLNSYMQRSTSAYERFEVLWLAGDQPIVSYALLRTYFVDLVLCQATRGRFLCICMSPVPVMF